MGTYNDVLDAYLWGVEGMLQDDRNRRQVIKFFLSVTHDSGSFALEVDNFTFASFFAHMVRGGGVGRHMLFLIDKASPFLPALYVLYGGNVIMSKVEFKLVKRPPGAAGFSQPFRRAVMEEAKIINITSSLCDYFRVYRENSPASGLVEVEIEYYGNFTITNVPGQDPPVF